MSKSALPNLGKPTVGDLDFAYLTADQDGWFRCNGRAVNTSPAVAMAEWLQATVSIPVPLGTFDHLVAPGKDFYFGGSDAIGTVNYQFVVPSAAAGVEDVTVLAPATLVGTRNLAVEYYPNEAAIVTPPGANVGSITVSRLNAVAPGVVAAGAGRVSITNVGTTAGQVLGVNIEVDETVEFSGWYNPATYTFLTLPAIAYTASATSILHINVSI